jgi:subtilase family serine protease
MYTPAQMRHAYGFDQISFTANGHKIAGDGTGQTIAIVDAYDDPNIAADLHTFDQHFGLPDPTFVKATPQGRPAADAGWSMEMALDVEYAHAIAPGARIMLVEAHSSSFSDIFAAIDYARRQPGVAVVSMSLGGGEFNGENTFDNYFTTPSGHGGVTFVASSGDNGAGVSYPAASPNVLAVGGTALHLTGTGNYASESGWSGSGGGVSGIEKRPAYQVGFQTSGNRSTPDVAYNADPNTGVYVYDSVNGGWFIVGGTSAGAPQWAALVAIADQGRALAGKASLDGPTQTLYGIYKAAQQAYAADFNDITTGSNGYSAHAGYDLVTGLGSPKAQALVAALVNLNGSAAGVTITSTTGGKSAPWFRSQLVGVPEGTQGLSSAAGSLFVTNLDSSGVSPGSLATHESEATGPAATISASPDLRVAAFPFLPVESGGDANQPATDAFTLAPQACDDYFADSSE